MPAKVAPRTRRTTGSGAARTAAGSTGATTSDRPRVPATILARLRKLCLALPGAYEEQAWTGTRWMVKQKNFAHVVAIDAGWPPAYASAAASEGPLLVLTFRTSADLAEVLRNSGPRFFFAPWGTRWGTKVIGYKLEGRVDWKEVATLVTESHRLLTPRSSR